MGQGSSHHNNHHYHHHSSLSLHNLQPQRRRPPMEGGRDSPASPQQVRQRVQQQQQQQQQYQQQSEATGGVVCCAGGGVCSCGGGVSLYGSTRGVDPVVVTPPRAVPPHLPHGGGCAHWCSSCRVRVQLEVQCVGGESRPVGSGATPRGGRLRTLSLPRRPRPKNKATPREAAPQPKKKKTPWTVRLNCRLRPRSEADQEAPRGETPPTAPQGGGVGCGGCMCPAPRRPEPDPLLHSHHLTLHYPPRGPPLEEGEATSPGGAVSLRVSGSEGGSPGEGEDWEEQAKQERAREMDEGVEPPPGFGGALGGLSHHVQQQQAVGVTGVGSVGMGSLGVGSKGCVTYNPVLDLHMLLERSLRLGLSSPAGLIQQVGRLAGGAGVGEGMMSMIGGMGGCGQRTVHTQVDYIHCLVPDLLQITGCVFYWGKMDRYEAERLLDNRPEGTFLLRDSAQEEYLFSVSFRRYGRSLHARIEQWNHKFSFDSHDPGVFASATVCGLIEHYKDPSCCMFFEPMLTNPLPRSFPFPLQHLCRAAICAATTYDGISSLRLPKPLHAYLKEYHYKQRVRVRRLDH